MLQRTDTQIWGLYSYNNHFIIALLLFQMTQSPSGLIVFEIVLRKPPDRLILWKFYKMTALEALLNAFDLYPHRRGSNYIGPLSHIPTQSSVKCMQIFQETQDPLFNSLSTHMATRWTTLEKGFVFFAFFFSLFFFLSSVELVLVSDGRVLCVSVCECVSECRLASLTTHTLNAFMLHLLLICLMAFG